MIKRVACLLVLASLVACTPANPPQALDAGELQDLGEMSVLDIVDDSSS